MVGKVGKKVVSIGMLLVLSLTLLVGCSSSDNKSTTKKESKDTKTQIGILQIVEHGALDSAREGFEKALDEKGYKDKVEIEFKNAQGDTATANTIAKKFVEDDKDLLFGIATQAAQSLYTATEEIPILITAVTDPVAAKLVKSLEKPGTNVTGTSDHIDVKIQFKLLKELYPDAKKVGVIYNTSEANSEVQVEEATKVAKEFNLELEKAGITNSNEIAQGVDSLLEKVDALYIPTDNIVVAAMPTIATKSLEKKIPVIATDTGSVEKGALATEGIDYEKLGYETGLMAIEIIKGKKPSEMPIRKAKDTELIINKKTFEKLGIELPKELKDKAKFI